MDYITWYVVDAEEFFFDFMTQKVDVASVLKLCQMLEFDGEYKNIYSPMPLQSLVLLHGSMEKNYTADEISYLQCSHGKVLYCLCKETLLSVIFTEIDVHEEDRDLIASAITKIITKAFGTDILLCFRHGRAIAFGITSNTVVPRINYTVSCWYSTLDIPRLIELCMNCRGDFKEIEYEITAQGAYRGTNYDFSPFNYGYLPALRDIEEAYSVDLSIEIERYFNTYFQSTITNPLYANAKYINDMLKDIGSEEMSSYDYLEKAIDAECVSRKSIIDINESEIDSDVTERLKSIPQEIFEDAEKMLRYFNRVRLIELK